MVDGLTDVFCQDSTHFQSIDEVWRVLQDGVVGHEVRGSHAAVVGFQVHCCGISCMTTAEARMKNITARTGEDHRTRLCFQGGSITLFHTWGLDCQTRTWVKTA